MQGWRACLLTFENNAGPHISGSDCPTSTNAVNKYEISSTPSFVVNDELDGALSFDEFMAELNAFGYSALFGYRADRDDLPQPFHG